MSKRHRTECREDNEHLCIQAHQVFPGLPEIKARPDSRQGDQIPLPTNYGIAVQDPYCFILLHLRNKSSKNPLNINLPEVCIFSQRAPYDIVCSRGGFVRGVRHNQQAKLKLRDVNKIFKQAWAEDTPKSEHCMACFTHKEVLMLSDSDLFLACCKIRSDPFFNKLLYLRNKIPANNSRPISVAYNSADDSSQVLKLATESMLMLRPEQDILDQFLAGIQDQARKQTQQLRYANMKMVLYLNYEHNIRVKTCTFVYVRTNEGRYYFVDAARLQFSNLTQAIREREGKLARLEEQKAQILLMTPEKQQKYRQFEGSANVGTLQKLMTAHFSSLLKQLSFSSISDNKREQIKNEIAFKKLHPRSKYTYTQVINSPQFAKVKDEVLQTQQRKSLMMPSRHVMRYYNQVQSRTRVKTEVIKQTHP